MLTRRFYLFDIVSGVERSDPSKIAYISYARYLKLVINLDQQAEEMINVPYLKIDYRQRTYEFITEENALTRLMFSSEYVLDTEGFWKVGGAIFWVFFVFFVLILGVVTCCKCQLNMLEQNSLEHCQYLVVITIVNALDIFSSLMFWYLFLMTGYWFVFFKLQERVYCFLPASDGLEAFQENYRPYDILFGLVCSCKFV